MSFSQGYFDPSSFGHDQQNAHGLLATNAKAVLFIFEPKRGMYGDVGMRPFQYNFDQNFVNEIQEKSDLAKRGNVGPQGIVRELERSFSFDSKMIPSVSPTMLLRSSHLSDQYQFILLLSQKSSDLITGNTMMSTAGGGELRRIYTGYFTEEPVNFNSLSSTRYSINDHAVMVITHKTVLGVGTESTHWGPKTFIRTRSSEEFFNSALMAPLIAGGTGNGNELHLMTPNNCLDALEQHSDGTVFSMPGAGSNVTKDNGVNYIDDFLEQPSENVGYVVGGMLRSQEKASGLDRLRTHRQELKFDDDFTNEAHKLADLRHQLSPPRSPNMSPFDLDVNAVITPQTLLELTNNDLQIQPIGLERPEFYETADQTESSFTQQFSFLLASVIPPILHSVGLTSIDFTFEAIQRPGKVDTNFTHMGGEPDAPIPNQDLQQILKAVEYKLTDGLLKVIFDAQGDYFLRVSCNAFGKTIVRLDLIGQGKRAQADFELPSFLGGMISPLIGDTLSNVSNTHAVMGLYAASVGVTNKLSQEPDYSDFARNYGQLSNSEPRFDEMIDVD